VVLYARLLGEFNYTSEDLVQYKKLDSSL
jgi:hypothetical protein